MKGFSGQRLRSWSLIAVLVGAGGPGVQADSIPVKHVEGSVHGFLEMRSEDGHVIASGDAIQWVHGGEVTTRAIFTFKDGSVDDETTVFTQRRTLQLVRDEHIQKGPTFPHPMDVVVDARSGVVTVKSTGKDGKEEVKTDPMRLPPDVANGLIPVMLENLRTDAGDTTVPMVVATPKPRMVKLEILNRGEDSCSVAGSPRKVIHYEIKVELGGVAGVVAPLIGKAPPDIELWVIGGQAPTLVRARQPLYTEGPMVTIQLASPVWPEGEKAGG